MSLGSQSANDGSWTCSVGSTSVEGRSVFGCHGHVGVYRVPLENFIRHLTTFIDWLKELGDKVVPHQCGLGIMIVRLAWLSSGGQQAGGACIGGPRSRAGPAPRQCRLRWPNAPGRRWSGGTRGTAGHRTPKLSNPDTPGADNGIGAWRNEGAPGDAGGEAAVGGRPSSIRGGG